MFCINCGAEVNGRFCSNCGTRQPDIAQNINKALEGTEPAAAAPDPFAGIPAEDPWAAAPSEPEPVKPAEPAWEAPKAEEPVWEAPKPAEPVWEEPKPAEPAWEAPKPAEPAWEAPKPAEPVWEEPKPAEPVWEAPKPAEPVWEEPKPAEPAWEAPKPAEPVWEAPKPAEPAADPFAGIPAADPWSPAPAQPEPVRAAEPAWEAPQPAAPAYQAPQPEVPAYEAPRQEAPPYVPPQPPRAEGPDTSYIPPEPEKGKKKPKKEKPPKERGPEKVKARKSGKKTVLFIVIAVLAVALIGGIIMAVRSCGGGSSKKGSGSQTLIMVTEKGAVLVGDANHELVPKNTDDYYLSPDYTRSLYYKGSKLFFNDGKKETQITKDMDDLIVWASDFSVVVYANDDGDILLWTAKGGKEIETGLEEYEYTNAAMISPDGSKAAVGYRNEDGDNMLYVIDTAKGSTTEISDEAQTVVAVLNDGSVIYINEDMELLINSGKKDSVLAEDIVRAYYLPSEKKLLYLNDDAELILRGTGDKDKETVAAEDVVRIMPAMEVMPGYGSIGVGTFSSGGLEPYKNIVAVVNDDDEVFTLDIKTGKLSEAGDGDDFGNGAVIFTDASTCYFVADGKLQKGTLKKDKWETETLSKHADQLLDITSSGGFVYFESGKVYVWNGKSETELASKVDVSAYQIAVAKDGKTLAYIDGGNLMYVSKAGEKGEKLMKDASESSGIYIVGGKIYYLNEKDELVTVTPKGKTETIADDISYFWFTN